jgi:phosphatidylserine decarboxylase
MPLAFEFAFYEIVAGLLIELAVFGLPIILIKHLYIRIILICLLLLFSIFWLQFFRNPPRKIVPNPDNILAPADGKVVEIVKVFEDRILKKNVIKIGIFMSPFDCHINRIPVNGTVENLLYSKGKKLPAYTEGATSLNENMITHIKNNRIDIVVKQIAGVFARRIKNKLQLKMEVIAGEPFGMILIGSKTEVFIPEENIDKIMVKINDRVKAGISILATIK